MSLHLNQLIGFGASSGIALGNMPSFGARGTGASGTATVDVPYPAGITAGDLLLAAITAIDGVGGGSGVSEPSGWTSITGGGGTNGRLVWLFGKIASGSESGTLQFINSSCINCSGAMAGVMARYTGPFATPFYEAAGVAGLTTSAAAAPSSITCGGNNRLAVAVIGTPSATPTVAAISGATGGVWSESAAETVGIDFQHAEMASGGTISGGTATLGSSTAWIVATCALRPVGA